MGRYDLDTKKIKLVIEDLINREYLKKDESDSSVIGAFPSFLPRLQVALFLT